MTLVVELRRGAPASRTGRAPGPRPAAGTLERMVVDDAFGTALDKPGRHRLPTLTAVAPYGDTVLRGEAVDRTVREPEGADLARPGSAEREVVTALSAWGLRCRTDGDLRIAFPGD
ncbi:hypothetical protein [Streptomyces griseomycini]|uniref:Uncharacterized protein n=1 Tax=Streptomyces griseomycini TaxID=66895 RepID=A0A7W7M1B5_9ACTN|nr:hypothetical protein [Streptomyces griseomycini]MBB4900325.1 hypothetical protein [Streptomyces griseomycini]GGR39158.1 hypothetical protein GCM10015536_51320 [Streptomyces griseomycini]